MSVLTKRGSDSVCPHVVFKYAVSDSVIDMFMNIFVLISCYLRALMRVVSVLVTQGGR